MQPIYTPENCGAAYQLNWSLSLFANTALPARSHWFTPLAELSEQDGVRLLECHHEQNRVPQFLASTQPGISPDQVVRCIKGRLQYLLHHSNPRAFRRNYRLESVGEVNNRVLQEYVARQVDHHPMADPRVRGRLTEIQVDHEHVDLTSVRYSAHGQFVYNLHLVLENAGHLADIREPALRATREMVKRTCAKKKLLLSRAGIVSNHLHLLLGCGISHAPLDIAMSFLNNLAYTHGMKPVFAFGFYVGTFGNYDRDAIRRVLF